MNREENLRSLTDLSRRYFNGEPATVRQLPPSGSNRLYYRISYPGNTVIGAFNPDARENNAFIEFTKQFRKEGLPVPDIYLVSDDKLTYLIEDLGDDTLFSRLEELRTGAALPDEILVLYKKVLSRLPGFQFSKVDYSYCYPRAGFDKQSMMWDLNYFKYYFLKLAGVPFDEQFLEDDFQAFSDFLLKADSNFFLYRDFQSRNIMIVNDEPHFIDYQGGRKGALQYDLASLLFDAKANLPAETREELLNYYLDRLDKYMKVDRESFIRFFHGFVLIRIMQAMGAYGFRGFYEKKEHFLRSIPFAVKNLQWLLSVMKLPVKFPYLEKVLTAIVDSKELMKYDLKAVTAINLTVKISSFSFRHEVPVDDSGNGGGYIFDCRALPNPGKMEHLSVLSGLDPEVINFLGSFDEVKFFNDHVYAIVSQSVRKYIERDFTHLMVNFGCTGGQHRSVFCAEALAERLKKSFGINITVEHTRKDHWHRKA